MDPKSREWLRTQVKEFVAVRPAYEKLADTLKLILDKARARYCPQGRVDARAKSIASFAEKALRKREKYGNDSPLERMTDLAGARIVVYTLNEAQAVCRLIERQPGFRIDWKNSLDVRQQMKPGEFGYIGFHYIVALTEASILGVDVPAKVRSIAGKRAFTAEIQIHTMLQNAWSVIGHDRLYKTEVKVPNAMKREIHAVAATLESADQAFSRSVESLDHYIRHFAAYRSPRELQDEIEMWQAICDEGPNDNTAVHKLGRCLMAAQQWAKAYDQLITLKDVKEVDVQRDLGQSAWKARKVRAHLKTALDLDPEDVRTLCALANTYRDTDLHEAVSLYQQAFAIDPNEPAVLAPFVECHIRREGSLAKLELMRGAFVDALRQSHERASRGVYLPHAHFNCARLHLYLGDAYPALNSYCMAIATCHLPEMISEELDALTRMLQALKGKKKQEDLLDQVPWLTLNRPVGC